MSKKRVSLGFTYQVEDYNPVRVDVMHERDAEEGETLEQHEKNLTTEVMDNLRAISKGAVADIQKIKLEIYNDLLDEEG